MEQHKSDPVGQDNNFMCSGAHLDKQLLQILLELLGVGGDGHGADICEGRVHDGYLQRNHTEAFGLNKIKSSELNQRCGVCLQIFIPTE